jgi:hypothetical protein
MLGPWMRGSGAGMGVSVAGRSRPQEEERHHAQPAATSKEKKNRGRMSSLLIAVWLTLSLYKARRDGQRGATAAVSSKSISPTSMY